MGERIKEVTLEELLEEPEVVIEQTEGIEAYECFIDNPNMGLAFADMGEVTVEKWIGHAADKKAPDAIKLRISKLGFGGDAILPDGSKVKLTYKDVLGSTYVKNALKEWDDYYVKQLGYRQFTQEDKGKMKTDFSQYLCKLFSLTWTSKLSCEVIDGHGYFSQFATTLGKEIIDNLERPQNEMKWAANQGGVFIIYVKPSQDGKPDKVFSRRFITLGVITKKANYFEKRGGSGGIDIGKINK